MTREEALQAIKAKMDYYESDKRLRAALETLVPELAESEDERMLRVIGLALTDVPEKRFTSLGITLKDCLTYLEKQKDRMKPIYDARESFESALEKAWKSYNDSGARTVDGCEDDYVECAHAKGFREGFLYGLEKQKENPKSAISIPSDCVSSAKCEDRWHKVGDSLPDNPREVLCKDEAGNFFIGRYYVGEGWEISNYDDEDKPHHINPPVSKWIDFPSEKQKEQKPKHFELKAGKWYICHRAFCCRADHLTVKEGERFQCEKDGIVKGFVIKEPEKYFKECSAPAPMEDEQKEQKPAEWSEEDEKMLTDISWAIRHCAYDDKKKERVMKWFNDDYRKSLRPSWKPSDVCYGAKGDPDPAGVWKPSEEQIQALEYVVSSIPPNYLKEQEYMMALIGQVIQQLKKLI